MANPYLPNWEYIPDGEPRVFGDRVYVYGSHDRAGSDSFCDYVLKCWSAPLNNLNNWTCHGDIFHTLPDADHPSDTLWTDKTHYLYAPDVVEKDGKYYLYAYIINSVGCVAVSDRPEGPFKLLSQYKYTISDEICCNGWFIDPGVLVDDDNQVYIYCGFEDALSPYKETPADIACVLKGGAYITEKNVLERVITNITEGTVIGYKYYDFGEDFASETMEFAAKINGFGCDCILHILIDDENGAEIGSCAIGHDNTVLHTRVKCVTGRHALFFKVTTDYSGWTGEYFKNRMLFELKSFVFMK